MLEASTPARPASPPLSVILLAWPLGLLLLEATALTPFVEFSVGGMAWLANPFFLTAGIVSLATFFLILMATDGSHGTLPEDEGIETPNAALRRWKTIFQPGQKIRWRWAGVHVGLLALFFWLSLALHARARSAVVSWPLAVLWLVVGGGVAISILLAFVPLTSILSYARRHLWQASVAVVMGVAIIIMTPDVRSYWPLVAGPALEALNVLLNLYPGEALIILAANRWPIIGTPRISLLVTPACSELDSVLVFVLLSGTLWAARGSLLSAWKYLLVLVAGLSGIYVLLILRLYFMILIGVWANSPFVAVKFAHSRISTVVLLLYTLGILYLGNRVARPVTQVAIGEEPSMDESGHEELERVTEENSVQASVSG